MNKLVSKKNENKSFLILLLFPILSYEFYKYEGFNASFFKLIYFSAIPLTILYTFKDYLKSNINSLYSKKIKYLVLYIFISIFIANIFWDQNIILGYRATAPFLAIIYFFLLKHLNPSIKLIEKIIWTLLFIYMILWLYALSRAPEHVFGMDFENGLSDERGVFRFFIPGQGIITLTFFLAINKFSKSKDIKWILIFSTLFIVIVLHVTRQVIIFSFIVGFFYLLFSNRSSWFWIPIIGFSLLISYNNIKISNDSLLGKLLILSESQIDSNKSDEEDIRITAYKYFFTEYSNSFVNNLIGNGIPHAESSFGKYESDLKKNGIYASDVGYASIFAKLGLLGLILYIKLFITAIKQPVKEYNYFAKLYIIFIALTNFASSWVFEDVILLCLCFYVLEKDFINNKLKTTN